MDNPENEMTECKFCGKKIHRVFISVFGYIRQFWCPNCKKSTWKFEDLDLNLDELRKKYNNPRFPYALILNEKKSDNFYG